MAKIRDFISLFDSIFCNPACSVFNILPFKGKIA
jgi:hypothetical protein